MDCTWTCECTCVPFVFYHPDDTRFFIREAEWKLWQPVYRQPPDMLLMSKTSETHYGCLCSLTSHYFKVIDASIPEYESNGTTRNCGYDYPSTGQVIELEAKVYMYGDGFEIKIYPRDGDSTTGDNIYRGVSTTALSCMPTCMMYHEDPETNIGTWYNYPRDNDENNNPAGNAVRTVQAPPNNDPAVYRINMFKTTEPYRPEIVVYLGSDPTACNSGCSMLSCVLCADARVIFPQEDSDGCCPTRLWDSQPQFIDYWANSCEMGDIGELDDGSPICQRYHLSELTVNIPGEFQDSNHEICALNICDLLTDGGGDYGGNVIDNQGIWWQKSDNSDAAWKETPAEACSDDTCVSQGGQVWKLELDGKTYWACVANGIGPNDPGFPEIEFCLQIPCVLSGFSEYEIRLWGNTASPQLGAQVQLADLCTTINTDPPVVVNDPDRNSLAFVERVYNALPWTNPNGQWDQRNGVPICEWGQNDLKLDVDPLDICAFNILAHPTGTIEKYECPLCVPSPETCPNDPAQPGDPDSLAPCVNHKLVIIEGTSCQDAVQNAQTWVQTNVDQPVTAAAYADGCAWVYPKARVCAVTYRNCQINPPDNDHQLPWASLELTICYSCPPGCHWECNADDPCKWQDETNNYTQKDGYTVNGDCEDLYNVILSAYNDWMSQMGDRNSPALDTGSGPDVFNYWLTKQIGNGWYAQETLDIQDLCECDGYENPPCSWCQCVNYQYVAFINGGPPQYPHDESDCECLRSVQGDDAASDCYTCHEGGDCGWYVIAPDNSYVESCIQEHTCWGPHCEDGVDYTNDFNINCGSGMGGSAIYPPSTDNCIMSCGDPADSSRVHVTAWYMSCTYDSGTNTATGSLRVCRWCDSILCDPRNTPMDYPHECYAVASQRLIVCSQKPNTPQENTWTDGVAYLNEVQAWLDSIDSTSNCYWGMTNTSPEVKETICYQTACDLDCDGVWYTDIGDTIHEDNTSFIPNTNHPPMPPAVCKEDPICHWKDSNEQVHCDQCDGTNYPAVNRNDCLDYSYNLLTGRVTSAKNDVLNNNPTAVFCGEVWNYPTMGNWDWHSWTETGNNNFCYVIHAGDYSGCWYVP